MTQERVNIYTIDFQTFSIELDVKQQSSIEWTKGFHSPDPDFVFAVGDIWLRTTRNRCLVIEELQAGNLIETLKAIEDGLRNPARLTNIEDAIKLGGWCSWMRGYWAQVDAEMGTSIDDKVYESLIPASVAEGREGHIACYMYDDKSVVEVATRAIEYIQIWNYFDSQAMAVAAQRVRLVMVSDLLAELN